MIKNIVFDMGNVLLLFDTSRFLDKYTDNAADRQLMLRHLFHSVEWVSMDRGTMTEAQAEESVCRRVPERLHKTVHLLLENWCNDLPTFPEVEAIAGRLKAAGYGVYLLSNTSTRFYSYRHHIPALKHFDGEFVSADWRMLKPDPNIYTTFCNHFGLVPNQCFFIDDNWMNIEGAMLAGMNGTVYHGDAAMLEDDLRSAGVKL